MTEHEHQKALFSWAALAEQTYPELACMYAIPNAGKRPGRQGQWMVAEGLKSGVPDIHLPVARRGYHGLFIEMKTERGYLRREQREWLWRLHQQGHLAVMCRGWDSARELLEMYLSDGDCRLWMEDYKLVVGENQNNRSGNRRRCE